MPTIAVSSWSVRHALGPMYPGLALAPGARTPDDGSAPVRSLSSTCPLRHGRRVSASSTFAISISRALTPTISGSSPTRMAAADVHLLTLLVDEGDISAADPTAAGARPGPHPALDRYCRPARGALCARPAGEQAAEPGRRRSPAQCGRAVHASPRTHRHGRSGC